MMDKLACLVMATVLMASTFADDYGTSLSYQEYKIKYGKTYELEEHSMRNKIFLENIERIKIQNALPDSSWKAGVNEFTDWSNDEFRVRKTGTLPPVANSFVGVAESDRSMSAEALPDTVDWRTKNVVTPVKNQGGCGSCWAFSATETLESAVAIKTGKLFELAPQQLVSCSPDPNDCGGTGGCQGSTQQLGFNYTVGAGAVLETSYPYKGSTGTCDNSKTAQPVAGITGYVTVQPNNYTALASAVAQIGPMAITVAAGGMGWQLYHSGVYGGGIFGCGYTLDHGVGLVGYGEDKGKMYWLVRNSWGAGWGEKGYMRIQRFGEGKEPCGVDKAPADGIACKGNTTQVTYCGECGIMSSSSYPTGAHLD